MGVRSSRVGWLTILVFTVTLTITANAQVARQPLITNPIDESQLVRLKGNTHPLAQPQFDMGVAPPNMPLNRMLLVLKRGPQQDFALTKLLDDQQDKNSPNFHKWLTPDQFGQQFGAADQDIQVVTGWLQTHGLQVTNVSHGRGVIEFSGVEAQVESAFHIQIHKYLVNGQQHWANASDPQIPAALAPAVAGVWSLHDFRKVPAIKISKQAIPIPARGASPLLTFQGQHALMPGDYAIIYNINPLYSAGINGQGATIAVVARSNIHTSDIDDFRSTAGLPFPNLNVINNGPDPGIFDFGEEFEAVLDSSWSGAVAPNAQVNFVLSASTNTTDGVDLSELYIIDNNAGDVMTESFSFCEGFAGLAQAQGISALAQQAAAEGISYMVASGDSGAEMCDNPNNFSANGDPPSVNVLASSAFTIAVGGTMFNENGNNSLYWNVNNNQSNLSSAKSYIPEDVWNESCANCGLWSGGGGVSTFFSKPNWQAGVSGIPADGMRDLPDVSLSAAGHDPYLLCFEFSCSQQGSLYGVSGTSASAPSFAGIMAMVVQQYGRQGQANYVLYKLAAGETPLGPCNASNTSTLPASTCIFNDVTVGNNAVPGEPGFGTNTAKYQAGTGYDEATGLGSVNANNLVTKWNTVNFNATTTTLGPASISGAHGSPITLNVKVAPSSGSGTPTGDVSLLASSGMNNSPGFLTLNSGSMSAPVNNLPGGNYSLTARYGGDATFAPSTSAPISVNITPEGSATTLSLLTFVNGNGSPFTGGAYGNYVYIRADVAANSGNGFPSGNVSFVDNGTTNLGSMFLNSQGNTATPALYFGFSVGAHSLVGQYQGDSSFNASTSAASTFTISQASTTSTVSPSSSAVTVGSPVTLTATVSSPAFAGAFGAPTSLNNESMNWPGGTVTFFAGGTQIGTGQPGFQNLTPSGVSTDFTFTTSNLPSGQNTITAQYAGDTNYTASAASGITVSVSADFTFAATNSTVTIASPGGSGTNTLTITGQTGYSGTINFTSLSCAGLPNLSSCSFNPPSVNGSGSTVVTFNTTAPTFAALHHTNWTPLGMVFAGVLLLGVPRKKLRSAALLSILLAAITVGGTACGGGSSTPVQHNPGTPTGTYPITITAKTSDGLTTHTASFNLVVQ